MNDVVLLGKALSDPTRIRILTALLVSELCVCELCEALELTQSTLSSHLQTIRQAGLVDTRKDGKWIYYGLVDSYRPLVVQIFDPFSAAMACDKRLQRDLDGVQTRLKLRVDNCCVLGFGPLNTKEEARNTSL